MNANFAVLAAAALNRTAGTVTGALTSSGGSLAGSWAGSPTITGGWTFAGANIHSAASTVTGSFLFDSDALRVYDTNASHALILTPGSDLTANRVLTLTTGDAARTLTMTGDATLNQDVSSTGTPTFATVDTGQGANELYDMDQNVLTSSSVTHATLDTGQGANELYDMDQNVLVASTPTFAGLTTTGNTTLASGSATSAIVGGGATASDLRLLEPSGSGTNYTAFKSQAQTGDVTYTLPAADGSANQLLSTNGSGTLAWASPSGPPRIVSSTLFESSGRFTDIEIGGGLGSFGTVLNMDTSAVATSSDEVIWTLVEGGNGSAIATVFPTEFNIHLATNVFGTDVRIWAGLGNLTVAGAGITFTGAHVGFKVIRAASGAASLFATQADGATETASSALTTIVVDDSLDLSLSIDGASSVRYWWRKNNGSWSSATTLTTNIPTSAITTGNIGITNMGVATRTNMQVPSASFIR